MIEFLTRFVPAPLNQLSGLDPASVVLLAESAYVLFSDVVLDYRLDLWGFLVLPGFAESLLFVVWSIAGDLFDG